MVVMWKLLGDGVGSGVRCCECSRECVCVCCLIRDVFTELPFYLSLLLFCLGRSVVHTMSIVHCVRVRVCVCVRVRVRVCVGVGVGVGVVVCGCL